MSTPPMPPVLGTPVILLVHTPVWTVWLPPDPRDNLIPKTSVGRPTFA